MSMDEVYERMAAVERELEEFNARLRASFLIVRESHDAVLPLWQDAMKREYDRTWEPLEETMRDYVERVGPLYVETLLERVRAAARYLHGS